jgi:hypothetical protein
MTEIWKAIPGHEGAYEVSDQGRVRSLARTVPTKSRSGNPYLRPVPERILRPGPQKKSGHLSVILSRKGGMRQVHELVLTTFVSRPPDCESCHNDGDPTNNRLDNLRWDTRHSNIMDAIRKGSWFSEKRRAHLDNLREIGRENFHRINRAKRDAKHGQ